MFKVLVVDDEPDILLLLGKFLKREGYDVAFAENGQKAFELIQTWKPDFVISDVQMPVWDGFELLKGLEELGQKHPTPILIISGYIGGNEAELRNSPHFVGFMAKPFNIPSLLQTVRSFAEIVP